MGDGNSPCIASVEENASVGFVAAADSSEVALFFVIGFTPSPCTRVSHLRFCIVEKGHDDTLWGLGEKREICLGSSAVSELSVVASRVSVSFFRGTISSPSSSASHLRFGDVEKELCVPGDEREICLTFSAAFNSLEIASCSVVGLFCV